jgi:hypothetical protein
VVAVCDKWGLSSDAKCNTPRRFAIGKVWTPEQISGWLKSGNAAAGHRLRDNLRPHRSNRIEGRGLVALSHAARQMPRRPRRARASSDAIKDRASIHDRPKTIEGRRRGRPLGGRPHHLQNHPACAPLGLKILRGEGSLGLTKASIWRISGKHVRLRLRHFIYETTTSVSSLFITVFINIWNWLYP